MRTVNSRILLALAALALAPACRAADAAVVVQRSPAGTSSGSGVADVVSTKLGSAATTILVSGLTGDADGGYLIDFYLIKGDATNPVTTKIQINGSDSGMQSNLGVLTHVGSYTADPSGTSTGNFLGWGTAQTGWVASGQLRMPASASGEIRVAQIQATTYDTVGNATVNAYFGNLLHVTTATVITSIGAVASVVNGLGTGSWMRVTKLHAAHP